MNLRFALIMLMAGAGVGMIIPTQAAKIEDIQIESREGAAVDKASVRAFTSVKVGDEFSRADVNRDVKALQKCGRFTSVSVERDFVPGGVSLTYVVEPKPTIRELEIYGADFVGNKKVRELLGLGVGDIADDETLAVNAQKVKDHYQKKYFPDAKLNWTLSPSSEKGMVNVRIDVVEGKRANVKAIRFEGNRKISARQLRKVMKQRTVNWLSFITGVGSYSPDDLESDKENLRRAYLDQGYLDAKIQEPEVMLAGRKTLKIVIPVEEGAQYRIGQIALGGITLFSTQEVAGVVLLKRDNVASLEQVDKGSQAIRDFFGSRGYIHTGVDYDLDADPAKRIANVSYEVKESSLAHIRNILIRGNSQTKDKVIRRELTVYPGEIFNEVKVRNSERRLRNLGYFSYVNSMPLETTELHDYDLAIDVEEQKTGQFMIGAGFSSIDDLIGFVELSQGNFDLFDFPRFSGGGQKLKIRTQLGTKRTDYELSFVEPWFLNRRLSLGLDLFEHESQYFSSEYDQRNLGANITLGKPLGSFNRLNLIYGLEQVDVLNVSSNASELIKQEAGKRKKYSLTAEIVHDSRDNFFIATRGNRTILSATGAGGPLQGDTDIYSFEARSSQYFPLWFDHVLSLRGTASMVNEYGDSDRVPIFDRLFLGGARTVRGFKFRDVGPKDSTEEPIGGKSSVYATMEYTLPVAEKMRLAAFYDAGIVWSGLFDQNKDMAKTFNAGKEFVGDGEINTSAGFGIRFDFPGFPIQLDYSWPLKADIFNDRRAGRFSFWLGYTY